MRSSTVRLHDWLTDRQAAGRYWCDATPAHAQLAHVLRDRWQADEYALRYLPGHLVSAADWDGVAAVLTDLRFLETKVEAGFPFLLARDFAEAIAAMPRTHPRRRILQLLEEALRLEHSFPRPSSGDALPVPVEFVLVVRLPEAARHYERPAAGWEEQPPWEQSGPKLYELLEQWRQQKSAATPRFRWLRSHRPPPTHLGTALRRVLRGHEDEVRNVALSATARHSRVKAMTAPCGCGT